MSRQLYKQTGLFGEVESCHSAADYLLFAEELVTKWKNQGATFIQTEEDFNKAVIAAANTFSPMFDEECGRLNLSEDNIEFMRRFMTRVLGNPKQLSQETFSREWRKLREDRE
jgi:hypothetical protein